MNNPKLIFSKKVPTLELWKYFLHLGFTGFGGPLAIVAKIQTDFIAKGWAQSADFNTTTPLIKSMPGPVALQTAAFWGYQLGGIQGALVSSVGMVLPAAIMMIILAALYPYVKDLHIVLQGLKGLQVAALVLIIKSIFDLSRPLYKNFYFRIGIGVAFGLIFLNWSEPLIFIFCAGISYILFKRQANPFNFRILSWLPGTWPLNLKTLQTYLQTKTFSDSKIFSNFWMSSFFSNTETTGVFFVFWWPFLFILFTAGALVFGTGMAILPFLQSQIVDTHQWMSSNEFLDALAFAQLTPGPVLIIGTFIGYRLAGPLGALLSTVVVFLPGFIHMTTWFPVLFKKIKSFSWIQPVSQGMMGAVISTLLFSTLKLSKHFNPIEIALAFVLIFVSIKWKIPSYFIFLIGAVTGMLFLS